MKRPIPLLFLLFLVGCSLLEGPQQPDFSITPAPSLAPPTPFVVGDTVYNPVSDIVPAIDPTIQQLMEATSRQNLTAYVQQLEGFGTRNAFSATDQVDFGVGAARQWLFNEFVRVGNGRLIVEYDDFPVIGAEGVTFNQQNIVARLPGTGDYPGIILMTAHYDSRTIDPFDGASLAPGANDNASGVAAMLEAARLMSAVTWNHDVVFVAFAAEEIGTRGSSYFVGDRLLDGWQIDAVINLDIVGGRPGIPQSLRLFSPPPESSGSRQFARYLDFIGGLYMPTFRIDLQDTIDRPNRYSDHVPFLDAGIPAIRLTESVEDSGQQHNAFDVSSRLDYNYLRTVTQLSLVTLANAAGAPARPIAPVVAPMADPGAYILSWEPDPLAAGYAISFRPIGLNEYPVLRYVSSSQAGNVAITNLNAQAQFQLSIAAIDDNGRISPFSLEIPIPPE